MVTVEVNGSYFTARGHDQVMNHVNRLVGRTIRDNLFPFHFMTIAYKRYPGVFKQRTKKYQIMKAKVVHHQRPNEFTGALRQQVLNAKIAATKDHATIKATAPATGKYLSGPKIGQTKRRFLTEDRKREIEYISPEEIDQLIWLMKREYTAAVYDPQYQSKLLARYR